MGLRNCLRRVRNVATFVVSEQLSYRPGRIKTALRIAAIVATYAALMAILHVQSGTAQYALWLLVAPPGPMWRPSQIFQFALASAALMALSVPLAGFMAQAPGVMLLFILAFSAVSIYAVNALRLGARGFVLQLIFLEAFYSTVVLPTQAGFQAANTFAGYLIAFFVIALFDGFLWPNPAEPILVESLSVSLRRECQRLLQFIKSESPNGGGALRPLSSVESDIAVHLGLLERACREGIGEKKQAVFLGTITHVEQIFAQIERLAQLVYDARREGLSPAMQANLDRVVMATSNALEEAANNIALFASAGPSSLVLTTIALRDHLRTLKFEISTFEKYCAELAGDSFVLGAMVHSLREIEQTLSRPFEETGDAAPLEDPSLAGLLRSPLDFTLMRFSLKTALAVLICFVIGFVSHDPRLWVAPVTVFTVAFQAYGTAIRRMFLRLGGSVIGGIIVIVVMTAVTPNLSSLPAYMLTAFSVVFIAGYAGLSSEKIAYAGRQIGDVFIIIFMGMGQPTNIYDPFWRIFGIFLGITVAMLIYKILWPQNAADQAPALISRLLRNILKMFPGAAPSESISAIQSTSNENTKLLAQLLSSADDARMEGVLSVVNPQAVIDSADALWKMSHRLAAINLRRIDATGPSGDSDIALVQGEELMIARGQLESWLGFFENGGFQNGKPWAFAWQIRSTAYGQKSLEDWLDSVEERKTALYETLTERKKLTLRGDLELFRHLHLLLGKLNAALPAIPARTRVLRDWREILKWNARTA